MNLKELEWKLCDHVCHLYGAKNPKNKNLASENKQAPPLRVPITGTQQTVFHLLTPKTNEQTKSSPKICNQEEVNKGKSRKIKM